MNIVPIVFAFDHHLNFPAGVCIFSLLMNAKEDTFYDIFILHSEKEYIDKDALDCLYSAFKNFQIHYRSVSSDFDASFEIRGITFTAYYRLLIPELIKEYDKILYSDVDVIFRTDLADLYASCNVDDVCFAGVNSLSHLMKDTAYYYNNKLKIDASKIIYSGNLVINSKLLREEGIVSEFKKRAHEQYTFQDMDIINIVCQNRIKYLPPFFCLTNYINDYAVNHLDKLTDLWTSEEVRFALDNGIIHYNGQKPWIGYCPNFDIWWEYYRKSPFFDEKYYFRFFKDKLNELDHLSLWKRIKVLLRWFFVR